MSENQSAHDEVIASFTLLTFSEMPTLIGKSCLLIRKLTPLSITQLHDAKAALVRTRVEVRRVVGETVKSMADKLFHGSAAAPSDVLRAQIRDAKTRGAPNA